MVAAPTKNAQKVRVRLIHTGDCTAAGGVLSVEADATTREVELARDCPSADPPMDATDRSAGPAPAVPPVDDNDEFASDV
jgi:hypothetical protein